MNWFKIQAKMIAGNMGSPFQAGPWGFPALMTNQPTAFMPYPMTPPVPPVPAQYLALEKKLDKLIDLLEEERRERASDRRMVPLTESVNEMKMNMFKIELGQMQASYIDSIKNLRDWNLLAMTKFNSR